MLARTPQGPSQATVLDRVLKLLALALLAAVLGFAAFYYTDRQANAGPGLLQQAISQAEDAVRNDPGHAGYRIAVATLYVETGRYDEAIDQFRNALAIDSDALAANYGLAIVYLERRQFAQAEAELQKVVGSRGDGEFSAADMALQAAYYHLSRAQLGQQKLEAAIATLGNALKIDRTDADSWELLGSAYLAAGQPDQAVSALERAALFVPDSPETFALLAQAYRATGNDAGARYAEAMVLFGRQSFDRAASELRALLEARPDDAVAWTGLGFAYEAQGMKGQAADAYRRALEISPGEFNARQGLLRTGAGPAN
jgi:cytochrome c-type biogenesis protein CcmH/NrfG